MVKIIELVGSSVKSWQDAAENVLYEAAKTVRNIVGMDVIGWTAQIKENNIVAYRVNVKLAFIAERP